LELEISDAPHRRTTLHEGKGLAVSSPALLRELAPSFDGALLSFQTKSVSVRTSRLAADGCYLPIRFRRIADPRPTLGGSGHYRAPCQMTGPCSDFPHPAKRGAIVRYKART